VIKIERFKKTFFQYGFKMRNEIDKERNLGEGEDNKIIITYAQNLRIEVPTNDPYLIGHLNEVVKLIGDIQKERRSINRLEQITGEEVAPKKRKPAYLIQNDKGGTLQKTEVSRGISGKFLLGTIAALIALGGATYNSLPQTSWYKNWKEKNIAEARTRRINNLFSNPELINYSVKNSLKEEELKSLQELSGIFPREAIPAYEFLKKNGISRERFVELSPLKGKGITFSEYKNNLETIQKKFSVLSPNMIENVAIGYAIDRNLSEEKTINLIEILQSNSNAFTNYFKNSPDLLYNLFSDISLTKESTLESCLEAINTKMKSYYWEDIGLLSKKENILKAIKFYKKELGDYIVKKEVAYRENKD
jgi:hypothetical protein